MRGSKEMSLKYFPTFPPCPVVPVQSRARIMQMKIGWDGQDFSLMDMGQAGENQ